MHAGQLERISHELFQLALSLLYARIPRISNQSRLYGRGCPKLRHTLRADCAGGSSPGASRCCCANDHPRRNPGQSRRQDPHWRRYAFRADGPRRGSGPALAEPFRATIIGYLSGPPFEILPIVAMLPKQIEGEAREKNCDFILYSSMTQKQGGGGLGSLKTLSMLASAVPMVGMAGGMAGAMTGAMAGSALSGAAGLTSGVKAKSQVSLEYKLVKASDGTSVDGNTLKQKAQQDGDDVITPLIQQAATSILAKAEAAPKPVEAAAIKP